MLANSRFHADQAEASATPLLQYVALANSDFPPRTVFLSEFLPQRHRSTVSLAAGRQPFPYFRPFMKNEESFMKTVEAIDHNEICQAVKVQLSASDLELTRLVSSNVARSSGSMA